MLHMTMQAGNNNNMSDFCDCSKCPHHCGGDEEETENIKDFLDNEIANEEEANKKVEDLKEDIEKIGFKIKTTKDGLTVSR